MKKYLPNSQFWITIVCESSFRQKWCSSKKAASSWLKHLHGYFPIRQPWQFRLQKCFIHTSISSHRVSKRHVPKDGDLIKLSFSCFSKDTHCTGTTASVCPDHWGRLGSLSPFTLPHSSFIHHCFCIISASINQHSKRQAISQRINKTFLPWDSLKRSQEYPGV